MYVPTEPGCEHQGLTLIETGNYRCADCWCEVAASNGAVIYNPEDDES